MSCPYVLVIEDDHDVREAIVEVLEDHAYVSIQATNGQEGIESLRGARAKPCLILLDIMMPVMDGRAFRAQQLLDPALGDIPVVVLTAHANIEEDADDLRAAEYLRKPVRAETLMRAVKKWCPKD